MLGWENEVLLPNFASWRVQFVPLHPRRGHRRRPHLFHRLRPSEPFAAADTQARFNNLDFEKARQFCILVFKRSSFLELKKRLFKLAPFEPVYNDYPRDFRRLAVVGGLLLFKGNFNRTALNPTQKWWILKARGHFSEQRWSLIRFEYIYFRLS